MVLLNFSFTGENNTGSASFTLTQEYKFKNIFLKDIKYDIRNEILEEEIAKGTAGDGLSGINTTITSALALHMDFLDSKDCVTYSLSDAINNTSVQTDSSDSLNTAQNITGLLPFGYAGKTSGNVSDTATISHSYPYHLIHNRPQTWASGKVVVFTLYYRDVQVDGLIKDWNLMSAVTDAFSDINSIDITLQLE